MRPLVQIQSLKIYSGMGGQPNYLPPTWTKPRASPNAKRIVKGVGRMKERPSMSPTPMTLIITKGKIMGLMKSHMRTMTTVIPTAVLAGRTDPPHHPSGLVIRSVLQ